MENATALVRTHEKGAQVVIGSRSFLVESSLDEDRSAFCPAELILGALGS